MRIKCAIGLLFLLAGRFFGQTVTTLNLSTQGHNPDFASFPFTRPISTGPAVPATCQLGQMFFNTAAPAGQNIYACTQTNTWTLLGAFTLLPAGPSTLGGVVVTGSSALNVNSNGLLSANVGTGPGTLAAGNDTRIANALQPTSQIPATNVTGLARSATIDTTSASNISTGIFNVSLFPTTINSNTTGNAATASSLGIVPKGCNVGQFSVGISATGTANCAQVAYTQVSGTPSTYNQTVQVAGSAQTQRTIVNFAAGSNLTITPSDNGSNTTTLTISGTGLQAPSTTNKLLKYTTGSSTTAAQASDVISALGFTPQNASGLNAPGGYAGLDSTGLLAINEIPLAINSNTTGKAATATALAATPVVCPGGQFATGIGANGNAICGTPTGTAGLPDPGSNGLVKRTAANADGIATPGTDYYAPGMPIQDADLPSIITSSITGNAASATALATAPAVCPGGQFATGIGPTGTAICGSPTGTGGLPDPGSNGLVKRTATNADAVAIAGTDYYAPGTPIADADLPNTITSSITGNAATATALAAAPTACAGGQFVIQINAKGNPVACGTAVTGGPSFSSGSGVPAISNCTSTTQGSAYQQTGVTTSVPNGGGNMLWVCSSTGSSVNSGFNWIPITGHQVNAMAFGCAANGSSNDQPCIQAAINLAQKINQYTTWDNGTNYFGNNVYLPCGDYAISSPIVLPRGGSTNSMSYDPNGGVVGLVGENVNCTALTGIVGSGFYGVGGVQVLKVGSGYTSAPSVTFAGGGCSTEPTAVATVQGAGSTIAFIDTVYMTGYGTGCTSMPSCTISGGGGNGGTCIAVGRAMIEWAPLPIDTYKRTFGEKISQIRFKEPNQDGVMAIHFQSSNYPINNGCTIGWNDVCERMESSEFTYLDFLGSNDYNPASFMLTGDCNTCTISHFHNNPSGGTLGGKYQTPLIYTSWANGSIKDEADGFQYGNIDTLDCGGNKGGSAPCFQGRVQRTTIHDTFCDGIRRNVGMPICYAFYNSAIAELTNIGNEGNVGVQMQLENSQHFIVNNLGIGSPLVTNGDNPLGGLSLLGSSENQFRNLYSMSTTSFATWGAYRVSTDATSYQNEFINYQIVGTSEVSISNTASNYMRYCLTGSTCNTNTPFSTIGTAPY